MRIEDHTSWCVANMAVLAGKLWFLGKSRSNPLCMGGWVGRGCCLARLSVDFRELSNTWKLLGVDGRLLPKLDTADRKPAGTGYPHIGDSSRKFAFLDSFRTPIAPKPEFFRNTHPCGWQGPSTPSNFQVFDSSLKSMLSRARQHPRPTHSPMHNGLDLDFPRNQSFPARTAIWATHPLVCSSILTRLPTP